MFHDVDHGVMFNGVKGFGEIQFEQYGRALRGLALVDVLECPCKVVLNRSSMYEAILVTMNNFQNDLLQTVGQEFGNEFKASIK